MRQILAFALAVLPFAALADAPSVVTDIGPTGSLVAQVMEGIGVPEVLVTQGGDPHSFQLRPSQARALAEADLVFWIGEGLTPWLGRVVAGGPAVSVELGETEGIVARPPMFGGPADEHDEHGGAGQAEDDHAEGEDAEGEHAGAADGAAEDPHDHGGHDPHVWLDPENAKAMLDRIAAELAAVDPGNAARYAQNATTAKAALDALTAEIAAKLAPYREAKLIVFHDAFAHFAGRFGLRIVGAVALGDAAAPGAAALAGLRQTIAEGGADCVFAEPQHSPALIDSLVADTGIRFGTLDPEGTGLPPGAELYPTMIRDLADAVAGCLGDG